ncbi:MAG TPA: hypothetical protein VJC05_01435 [Candidatus Andersenbacteria bacterium]|nr:hypothetical protein [Candidatus Andersenbacteria bacterium]
MTFWGLATVVVGCLVNPETADECWQQNLAATSVPGVVAAAHSAAATPFAPVFSGNSLDVELTAAAALVWDEQTDTILYERAIHERREVASLSKLLSALKVREELPGATMVEIPAAARMAKRQGAHVALPPGEHASVYDLLSAALIPSANDAMLALAWAVGGDEERFAEKANDFARRHGFLNTRISNATGLPGGEQFSTAADIKGLFQLAYRDQTLRNLLVGERGVLVTQEGTRRSYVSTNELLDSYLPILAGKTGYTPSAGQNLVIMTYGERGQRIGAVVLGSTDRFQDMKTLVEWVQRNYTWP